jgi:hypothetical protein
VPAAASIIRDATGAQAATAVASWARRRMHGLVLAGSCVAAIGCAAGAASTQAPAPTPIAVTPAEPPAVSPAPAPAPPPVPVASSVAPPIVPPIAVEGYTAEIAAALADPWWGSGSTRIAVARRGAVRLRPDGPDLGLRDQASFPAARRMKVVEDGERPRVVTADRDVRLLLHVERQDARPVLVRAEPLRPTPGTVFGDPPRRGHVVLQPGAWVDVEAREGAMVRVVYGEDKVRLSGWIEAEALGTTMTPGKYPADERPGYQARRATKLLARPGGKSMVALDIHDAVVAITSRATGGYRLVEYAPPCGGDLVYIGYVAANDLHQPNYGTLRGCGHGAPRIDRVLGEFEAAPRVTVAAGRFLLDPDAPRVVGCVLAPTEVAALGDGRYAVATIWGPVPVRLAPEEFAGKCGK